ncbi:MAG TPA: dodecin family protein [Anaerolineales bacterium]|jgi:flavin-binding protein dodecin|nr:dodecin family protein [Anaerolineales bacterium]
MSVARVSEIKASSTESFDDAIRQGVSRAAKTLRNVKSAWVANQDVTVDDNGNITEFRVQLKVTFVLDD